MVPASRIGKCLRENFTVRLEDIRSILLIGSRRISIIAEPEYQIGINVFRIIIICIARAELLIAGRAEISHSPYPDGCIAALERRSKEVLRAVSFNQFIA